MERRLRLQWIPPDNDPIDPDIPTWAKFMTHRFVRRSWLSVLMVLDHPPLYRDYRRRFGVSMDTVRRDIVRVIWLTALFARRQPVTVAEYGRRFGVSWRSFRRDVALLREAGFSLETTAPGDYRMLSFVLDSDAP